MWRKYQLTKHIAKCNHPYSKFSTGDKNSLANPNLRKMLHNFYFLLKYNKINFDNPTLGKLQKCDKF